MSANPTGTPRTGDIVVVFEIPLYWRGGLRSLWFQPQDNRFYACTPQGEQVVVAVGDGDDNDPLRTLSDKQLAGLLGVELWGLGSNHQRLEHVDFGRTCVSLRSFDALEGVPDSVFRTPCLFADYHDPELRGFPKFTNLSTLILWTNFNAPNAALESLSPKALQTFVLESGVAPPDPRLLREHKRLRVVRMSAMDGDPIDLSFAASLRELRVLELDGFDIANLGGLARLPHLETLKLESIANNQDLTQLGSLDSLVRLTVHGDAIDLSPIATLPRIAYVVADGSTITKLPDVHIPSLREVSLLDARVDESAVAALAARNPQAVVENKYEQRFLRIVGTADEIRVLRGGCGGPAKKTVHIARGSAVQRFLDAIEIEPTGTRLGCIGETRLEFYRGDLLLDYAHLFASEGVLQLSWSSDVRLTAESHRKVRAWLDDVASERR